MEPGRRRSHRLSAPADPRLPPPRRAVLGAHRARRAGLRRAGAQQDAWRPAACARRDRRAVRPAHAGRARGAAAAVPAPARPGRAVPRLPLWPRRRRPALPRARAGLRRRLHRAPREQSLVRATAAHQPQPDLLGDDARTIRAESEPVPPRNLAMRRAAVLVAALMLGACVTVPTKSELVRPARARAKTLDREGQLRPALLEWKVAPALDPDDAAARADQARLTSPTEGAGAAQGAQ